MLPERIQKKGSWGGGVVVLKDNSFRCLFVQSVSHKCDLDTDVCFDTLDYFQALLVACVFSEILVWTMHTSSKKRTLHGCGGQTAGGFLTVQRGHKWS